MSGISFSVIIPAYNAAATIKASVHSCLGQTHPPHEVIVVNDGSTDATEAVLEGAFGARIKYLRLEKNSGPAAARNAGLAIATGAWVAFQDADDLWHHKKLEHLMAVLGANPEIHFLFHPYTLQTLNFSITDRQLVPRPYPLWKLLLSNPIGTPCVVLKRIPGIRFDEELHFMEDYELFLREAYDRRAYRIAAALTRVGRPILSPGGQSSRRWQMRLGEIRAWRRFAAKHPAYYLLIGPLVIFALLKHLVKSFFPPRTNY